MSAVTPGSWDICLILTGFPFYAACIGVAGGSLADAIAPSWRLSRFIAASIFLSLIIAILAPTYLAQASRVRLGVPEEVILAVKSMDGSFEDNALFLANMRSVYYIPLYTRYDAKVMLNETGYYIPVNPLCMAGTMLSYEKASGRPTYLLLLPSDPMYRVLNPSKVVTPFAIVVSPKANDVTSSTEIVVIERVPISSIEFAIRKRGVVVYSSKLVKVSFNGWFGSFPPKLSWGSISLS